MKRYRVEAVVERVHVTYDVMAQSEDVIRDGGCEERVRAFAANGQIGGGLTIDGPTVVSGTVSWDPGDSYPVAVSVVEDKCPTD